MPTLINEIDGHIFSNIEIYINKHFSREKNKRENKRERESLEENEYNFGLISYAGEGEEEVWIDAHSSTSLSRVDTRVQKPQPRKGDEGGSSKGGGCIVGRSYDQCLTAGKYPDGEV